MDDATTTILDVQPGEQVPRAERRRRKRRNGIQPIYNAKGKLISYEASFEDPQHGRQRKKFKKYNDARDWKRENERKAKRGEYVPLASIGTVKEAATTWLDGRKVAESTRGGPVAESTIEFWQNHIDTYIVPTLGDYRLDLVDTALVEKKRDEWKVMGELSGKTVNKILTTLDAIYDKQVALRKIVYNPVTHAERMASGSNEVGTNDEMDVDSEEVQLDQVYGPDELSMILQSARPGFDQTILTLFALTMVRHGEALGLMWRDVDFDRKEIIVRRNWGIRYHENGEPKFGPTKGKKIRNLRIPDQLCHALKKWKLQCPPSKWDLTFPQADGWPHHRKTAWRALVLAVKKANENVEEGAAKLRQLTIHSLRHSGASIHLMKGTPLPEVSAMLGHANVNITLCVYTHFIPKMQTNSAATLADAIFAEEKAVRRDLDAKAKQGG